MTIAAHGECSSLSIIHSEERVRVVEQLTVESYYRYIRVSFHLQWLTLQVWITSVLYRFARSTRYPARKFRLSCFCRGQSVWSRGFGQNSTSAQKLVLSYIFKLALIRKLVEIIWITSRVNVMPRITIFHAAHIVIFTPRSLLIDANTSECN